jgi:hypothetical protein
MKLRRQYSVHHSLVKKFLKVVAPFVDRTNVSRIRMPCFPFLTSLLHLVGLWRLLV